MVEPEFLEDASQHLRPAAADAHAVVVAAAREPHFGIAYQLALLEFAPLIGRMLEAARPPDPGSRRCST